MRKERKVEEIQKEIVSNITATKQADWHEYKEEIETYFGPNMNAEYVNNVLMIAEKSFRKGFNCGCTAIVASFEEQRKKNHVVE